MTEIPEDKPSKSQLKRDADKLQALGSALVKLPLSLLNNFPLPDALFDAIKTAQSLKQNRALKRQLQFIGKLMRQHDTDKIQAMYDNYHLEHNRKKEQFHCYEQWRDRFLNNDNSAFSEFISQYPHTDRQRLHQLQRQAISEKKQQKPPKYARLLFNFLKENMDKKIENQPD